MNKLLLDKGYFTLTNKYFSIKKIMPCIEINGVRKKIQFSHSTDGTNKGNSIFQGKCEDTNIECQMSIEYDNLGMLKADISFKNSNPMKESYRIGRCWFIFNCIIQVNYDNSILLLQSGSCGYNKNVYLRNIKDESVSEVFSTLYCKNIAALNIGFITFDRAYTKVLWKSTDNDIFLREKNKYCQIISLDNPEDDISEFCQMEKEIKSLDVYCDFNNYSLKEGERIKTETFFIDSEENPYYALEKWAEEVQRKNEVSFIEKAPIGWIGGWNFRDGFYTENMETIIMENMESIRDRLNGFNVEYIWISCVNMKDNLPGNWIQENKDNFPDGLRWMREECTKNEMKLGLWVAPFWISEESENLEHVKNSIAKIEGKNVKSKETIGAHQPFGDKDLDQIPRNYVLDPSHTDTLAFLEEVFTYYKELGIRYYMIDFLGSGIRNNYDYNDKTVVGGPESYRNALKAVRDAAGDDTYLLASSGPTYYNTGYVDGVRASLDFGEGRPPIKYYIQYYPAGYITNNWDLIKRTCIDWACTYFTDKKLYHNDCFNMITIGQPISLNEARCISTMFGLSGNPFMMGDDIPSISEERLNMIKKCLPLHEYKLKPVDLWESVSPDAPHVWAMEVDKGWDKWYVVSIFNFNETTLKEEVNLTDCGIEEDSDYMVYDFWDEHCLGVTKASFTVEVAPHDVKVLRITRVREHPWIVGSDMHLSQGGVELSSLRWDKSSLALKGVCSRPAGETGSFIVYLPSGWIPVDFRDMFLVREYCQDIKCKICSSKADDNKDDAVDTKIIIGLLKVNFNIEKENFIIKFEKQSIGKPT